MFLKSHKYLKKDKNRLDQFKGFNELLRYNIFMKNDFLFRYIILKIQSNQWKENEKLPSERALMIKFDISKNLVHKTLEILQKTNIIYSVPSMGNFVSKKFNGIFNSKTKFLENSNVEISKSDGTLSERDIKNIKALYPKFNLNIKNLKCFSKKYINNRGIESISLFFLNEKYHKNFYNFNKRPFYEFLAYQGIIINKKITIFIKPIFNENNYKILINKKANHSDCSLQILIDFNNKVVAIIKTFDFYDEKSEIYGYKIEKLT